MEMGKLTAKLRDAVPVCFLVEGKEVKRYKNVEIPDELKKLEYQDFKFDVPLSGAITFKIMFEPGILPEEWPQARGRRTRPPKEAPAAVAGEKPVIELVNEAGEATLEGIAIITFQSGPEVNIPETQVAGKEVPNVVEVQAGDEAQPEAMSEPEAQKVTPTTKEAAKPKKTPGKGGKK